MHFIKNPAWGVLFCIAACSYKYQDNEKNNLLKSAKKIQGEQIQKQMLVNEQASPIPEASAKKTLMKVLDDKTIQLSDDAVLVTFRILGNRVVKMTQQFRENPENSFSIIGKTSGNYMEFNPRNQKYLDSSHAADEARKEDEEKEQDAENALKAIVASAAGKDYDEKITDPKNGRMRLGYSFSEKGFSSIFKFLYLKKNKVLVTLKLQYAPVGFLRNN